MIFHSMLHKLPENAVAAETLDAPDFFADLNLDQVVDTITAGRQEYNLKPFFYAPLHDTDAVRYRYEIMADLENEALFQHIKSFAQKMRSMREHLAQSEKLYYKLQKQSWFLDAVEIYCEAVRSLANDLAHADLKSRGFLGLREYITQYAASEAFTALLAEIQSLKADLASVKYCLLIKDNTIKVRKYEGESDYSAEVENTFAKFKQGAAKDYKVKFSGWLEMNHIEAAILDYVAQLYPDIFSRLDGFCTVHSAYLDETIGLFDREIQFYLAYLEYMAIFKQAGLKFCHPQISDTDKEIYAFEEFDLALAYKLIAEKSPIVVNDFYLKGKERIFVVSGPNQGGKTTFARTFGQLHYLASIGCPVPGREARLFLADSLFTHFEKEEDIKNLRGKLQDDLVRIHRILKQATSNSIIIMNEIFTSTALQDALFLGKKIIEKIIELDALGVYVTFVDELTSLSEKTVSMVSTVVPDNPALRTYKVIRRPADGLSYAIPIAEKYRLTYSCIKERIKA